MNISDELLLQIVDTYTDDKAKTDLILSLVTSLSNKKPPKEKPGGSQSQVAGSHWSKEHWDEVIQYREQGMGPSEIYERNLFPGRTKSAIRNILKKVYEVRPDLKDKEMARRASSQFKNPPEQQEVEKKIIETAIAWGKDYSEVNNGNNI